MTSLTKAVRPLLSLGLLGFACAAQSGAAQAQGGLNDFFSQLFAPPPQPSYVQPLVVHRDGRLAQPRRAEPMFAPQRSHVSRSTSADRVREVRLPRTVPLRVRHASLPFPAKEQAGTARATEDKAQSPKPIKIIPREPTSDPISKILNDPTLRRGTSSCFPAEPRCSTAGEPRPTGSATSTRFARQSCWATRPAGP